MHPPLFPYPNRLRRGTTPCPSSSGGTQRPTGLKPRGYWGLCTRMLLAAAGLEKEKQLGKSGMAEPGFTNSCHEGLEPSQSHARDAARAGGSHLHPNAGKGSRMG